MDDGVELKLEQLQPTVPPENEQVEPDRASVARLLGGHQRYRVSLSKLRAAVGLPPRTARERRARDAYQHYLQTGRWPWQRGGKSNNPNA